jgi:hypothetical protein
VPKQSPGTEAAGLGDRFALTLARFPIKVGRAMKEAGGARLNLLAFWCVIGGILVGANGIFALVYYTHDTRSFCLGCHEKTPGTKGLWDPSPIHTEGISCSQCHSIPGGDRARRFYSRPAIVNPNCMGCHQPLLEGKVFPRNVYVREAPVGGYGASQEVLYQWTLKDLMYTWHIQNKVCVCTDCHRNVSHDRGEAAGRYRPRMAYCAECHYHSSKDDYAMMRPLPDLVVEERARPRR